MVGGDTKEVAVGVNGLDPEWRSTAAHGGVVGGDKGCNLGEFLEIEADLVVLVAIVASDLARVLSPVHLDESKSSSQAQARLEFTWSVLMHNTMIVSIWWERRWSMVWTTAWRVVAHRKGAGTAMQSKRSGGGGMGVVAPRS
ncbi:hypothetical protein Acr_10g0004850 [Actinidia rufa]|uniref:Uncharacterized protein n=1 Tax=Actinidia rufa TaxID=165716 RepID=A0A7J0F8R0_9ERIC|nr:hypothetical protein Acr_10g0004850 [Actinidia rufa]